MIAPSAGGISPRRWRGFVAVVALVAAAATACVGSGSGSDDSVVDESGAATDSTTNDGTTNDGTATDSTDPNGDRADGTINLDQFEFSGGPGSLVVPMAARLPGTDVLGDDWFAFPSETKAVESCRFDDEQAWVARSFSRTNGGESAAIRIGTFPDGEAAAAALELIAGPGWSVCINDSLVQLNAKLDEVGALRAELVGEIGAPGDPILTDRDGFSRSYTYALIGGGVQLDLTITETNFVDGNDVVTIQTALLDDNHLELTVAMDDALIGGDDQVGEGEGAGDVLDANLAALRRAVLAEEQAAPFYDLLLAARVSATGTIDCVEQDDPTVTMFGPTWSTVNGISAIIQLGRGYRTPEEADGVMDELASIDTECLFEEDLAGSFAGEVFFEDSSVSVEERDGYRVLVVDITMTQRLGGNQSVDAEVAAITTLTRAGTEIVGWRFVGIRGDEPDLVGMTAEAAARAEGAS